MKATMMNALLSVGFTALLIAGAQRAASAQEGAPGPVRIGAILPLTGAEARQGEIARKAIELAAAEALDYQVQVFFEDDASEAGKAVSAFQKLLASNQIEAVITIGSPVGMALAPLANKSEVVLMGVIAAPAYSTIDDFTFRLNGSSEAEIKFLGEVLDARFSGKKIGMIYSDNDYGQGAFTAFQNAASGTFSLAAAESFSPHATDVTTPLMKLKASEPDAIVIAAWAADAGAILKKARSLGIKSQFFCLQACENKDLFGAAGGAADGLLVSAPVSESTTDLAKSFAERLKEAPSFVALRMADAVRILARSAQGCADYRRTRCMRENLSPSHEFPGSSFPIVFDEFGDLDEQFALKEAAHGKLVPVQDGKAGK